MNYPCAIQAFVHPQGLLKQYDFHKVIKKFNNCSHFLTFFKSDGTAQATQRRDYRLKNWALISGNWVLVSPTPR